MAEAYFATRTYRAQSPDLADERLVNAYLERSPEGAKSQVPVIGDPGITEFDDIGDGPTWGIHKAALGLGELLYVVSDDDLYSVDQSAVATLLGTVMGRRRVHMSDNGTQLIIVNGLHHYVYDTTDGLQKLKFGLGMDGDFDIIDDHDGTSLTTMTITITGGPASAANVNEIIVSIEGDSSGNTYFTDRPGDGDTIATVATDLAATIDGDGDYTASATANVITVTPSGANSTLDAATSVATSYYHTIEIGDSFETDDYITLTFELVGLSDVNISYLVLSSDTPSTIASALNTLIDAEGTLTSTVLKNVITAFGQTPGTHILTDIYSTQDWAVISGQAPYSKQVWALDGFFIYPVSNTPSFRISNLNNGARIDLLDVESLGAAHSNVVGICVNQREINVLGEDYGEIYRNTGAADFPFTRIPGAHIERGCAATYSIAKGESSWAWLGSDRRIYAMSGYTPQRISTHGIEHKIENYTTVDDAFSFVMTWKGHVWYVLTFPSENQTWLFDSTAGEWHERVTSFAGAGATDYTVPDLESGSGSPSFCGMAYDVIYADRPNDPGSFVMVNSPGNDLGGQGLGMPGVVLSENGKNWRRSPDTNINNAVPWQAVGYSRAQDRLLIGNTNDTHPEYVVQSVNGGLIWTLDVDAPGACKMVERVDEWDLWIIGDAANDKFHKSATGQSGTWTAISMAPLSDAFENGGIAGAYSASLDRLVIVDRRSVAWSDDGTIFADATTPPTTLMAWRDIIWVEDWTLYVLCGDAPVGSDEDFATSPDGKDYTHRTNSFSDFTPEGVAYSSKLGIAVSCGLASTGGAMVKSTDGTTWTEITASATLFLDILYFGKIAWSDEREIFVCGGKDSRDDGVIIWSEDGDNWFRANEVYA